MTASEGELCVAYDTHGNEPGNCCGCHYECGEPEFALVHSDSNNPKMHTFVPPSARKGT